LVPVERINEARCLLKNVFFSAAVKIVFLGIVIAGFLRIFSNEGEGRLSVHTENQKRR
jgi:hypothetical protein